MYAILLVFAIFSLVSILNYYNYKAIADNKLTLTFGKNYPDCKKLEQIINDTPDFFEQFRKRGYEYIYKDSPFKLNLSLIEKA
ncbi:Uncharacterised protein [Suttonella ornithocola]|uniref:Uncharacterized protein n=1 Tax=Suttonella ornithocola TaxID=279832 RepID=A0A380MPQ1_9GAMM|nr:Uncharacterised protein [Suttonella ornithocola]